MSLPGPLAAVTATSVGSLPHEDPVAAAELVLRAHPELPAAPQLPNRSRGELMLAQAADGLRGVHLTPDGALAVDASGLDVDDVESFGADCWDGLLTFLRLAQTRDGPVKVQLTGPVTLAVALTRGGAPPRRALDVATDAVRRRATAVVDLVDSDALVLCLDEPWLGGAHPAIPVEEVVAAVVESLGPAVVGGVHCCGHADWDALLDGLPIPSIASMPIAEGSTPAVGGFLNRGGVVAWGAVPTTPPLTTDAEAMWQRVRPVLRELVDAGCSEDVVRSATWITPECGLAGHSESAAEDALLAARRLAELVADRGL